MRILMITWEYPPHIVGGMGVHVADITPEIANEGIEVFILTPMLRGGTERETTDKGVQVIRANLPQVDNVNFITFVAHVNHHLEHIAHELYNEVGGFDIIHTHDWLTATSAIALKQRWQIPLIATIHATERGRGRGMLHGEQAQHIDAQEYQLSYETWRVIVCSQFMARQLIDTFQTPADKIDVVPNGKNAGISPFQDKQEQAKFRRLFAEPDEHIIFYVGRIVYEKGLHILLDALPRLLQHTRVRLVLAGTGPYLDQLKSQAEAMGMSQYITFTGFISDEDRDRLYHVADVTTFPSLYEPFGIVVLEANAARSPVVVSQTGGLMEVVQANETGITVIPGNAESLAQGILETIQNPEQTLIRVENAMQELLDHYNWRHIARETITVYQRVYKEWKESDWGKKNPQSDGEDKVWRCAG